MRWSPPYQTGPCYFTTNRTLLETGGVAWGEAGMVNGLQSPWPWPFCWMASWGPVSPWEFGRGHWNGFVWKWCVYPEKPNGFADHYPYEKWLFHWGYTTHFQTYPNRRFLCRRRRGHSNLVFAPIPSCTWSWKLSAKLVTGPETTRSTELIFKRTGFFTIYIYMGLSENVGYIIFPMK